MKLEKKIACPVAGNDNYKEVFFVDDKNRIQGFHETYSKDKLLGRLHYKNGLQDGLQKFSGKRSLHRPDSRVLHEYHGWKYYYFFKNGINFGQQKLVKSTEFLYPGLDF